MATYTYLIYSKISFIRKQKGRRNALINDLFCVYASLEDIERAVLEQNADLPEEELNIHE